MAQEHAAPSSDRLLVTGTVTFYMVAALSMVIANKWVLITTNVPLFFLLMQLVIANLLFMASHTVGLLRLPSRYDWTLIKGLAPMVILSVIGLSFSNFTLKYVDASFYQVARGLVLPFTVLTSYLFLSSRPSLFILVACSIVTLGFFVGVFLDGVAVSRTGVFFGVASSAVTAVHAVVIKKAIAFLGGSALDLSWYTNLLSSGILIFVVFLAGEWPEVVRLFTVSTPEVFSTFIWGSAITGVIGFLMGIASLLSIKITSPITHMISSAVRGVLGSVLGVWFFQDIISAGRAASIAVILAGSMYYTWVKHVESQPSSSGEKGGYAPVPLEDLESGKGDQPRKPE